VLLFTRWISGAAAMVMRKRNAPSGSKQLHHRLITIWMLAELLWLEIWYLFFVIRTKSSSKRLRSA
jgi:hypothetical protein